MGPPHRARSHRGRVTTAPLAPPPSSWLPREDGRAAKHGKKGPPDPPRARKGEPPGELDLSSAISRSAMAAFAGADYRAAPLLPCFSFAPSREERSPPSQIEKGGTGEVQSEERGIGACRGPCSRAPMNSLCASSTATEEPNPSPCSLTPAYSCSTFVPGSWSHHHGGSSAPPPLGSSCLATA
jgi:hypothetical protein